MVVLYNRVVHSEDGAPEHMQYLAGTLFTVQPIFFVFFAATIGRKVVMAE